MTAAQRPPARGRPRDAGREAAILDATLHLLTSLGYEQMSIEAVAAHAGVGKATIYRRYPDKATLVATAVDQRAGATPPETGNAESLREALMITLRWLADQIAEQEIGLLGAMFAGMRSDTALAEAMRTILRRDQSAMVGQVFGHAAARGEHLAANAGELFTEIAPALIVNRLAILGEPCDQNFLDHLVDDILTPLLLSGRTTP